MNVPKIDLKNLVVRGLELVKNHRSFCALLILPSQLPSRFRP